MKTLFVAAGGLVLLWWLTRPAQAAAALADDEELVGSVTTGTPQVQTAPEQVTLIDRMLCRCLYVPGVPCSCNFGTPPFLKYGSGRPYIGIVQAEAQ